MRSIVLMLLLAARANAQTPVVSYGVTRIAGTPLARFDGIPAADALLVRPQSLAQDRAGNLYISDARGLSMVTTGGQIRIVSGPATINIRGAVNPAVLANDPVGGEVLVGDNGRVYRRFADGRLIQLAGGADFGCVSGLAADRSGSIFVSCTSTALVRRIAPDGAIGIVAGTGSAGSNGDNGPAIRAQLVPSHLALDASGSLYIYDAFNASVRRVTDGVIRTIGGGGASQQDNVMALVAALSPVTGMAVDGNGAVYISEAAAHRIRRFTPGGVISAVSGSSGTPGDAGDGAAAGAGRLNQPGGLQLDRDGNVLLADTGNHRIRKLALSIFSTIAAVAGASHFRGDGGRALDALLNGPVSVSLDATGNVYIADSLNFRVRRVGVNGLISTFAGNGSWGFSGDQGAATAAQLKNPAAVAIDRQGTLYIADRGNDRIRRVNAAGLIATVAGTGDTTSAQLAGPGLSLRLLNPGPVVVDSPGNAYFAQTTRVSVLGTSGNVTAYAGGLDSGSTGDNGSAQAARFGTISGLALDAPGNLYITDELNHVVRRVTPSGVVQTIAGTAQVAGFSGDGGPAATALLNRPKAIAVDVEGNLFVADTDGRRVRRISREGVIQTVAGRADAADQVPDGQALANAFGQITSLAIDPAGQIYFADTDLSIVGRLTPLIPARVSVVSGDNQTGATGADLPANLVVRLTDAGGVPVAGIPVDFYVTSGIAFLSAPNAVTNSEGIAFVAVKLGDTGGAIEVASSTLGLTPVTFRLTAIARVIPQPPSHISYSISTAAGTALPSDDFAVLRGPDSVVVDFEGNAYFTDPTSHRILRRAKDGSVRLFAGNGIRGNAPVNDFAINARLNNPTGVAVDARGNVYFADRDNHRICMVDGDGVIKVVAGTGVQGANADRVTALQALFSSPTAVAIDAGGLIYIADSGNRLIRKIQADGLVVNVAGRPDISGLITSLAFDSQGNLYFVESERVRKLSSDGLITEVAIESQPAVAGVTVDSQNNLIFSEVLNGRVRRLAADGTLSTLAGTGVGGFSGDGGAATEAQLSAPRGVAVDRDGSLLIADQGNRRLRRVDAATGKIETASGISAPSGDGGQAILALLSLPSGLAVDNAGNLYISDLGNLKVRRVTPDGTIQTFAGNGSRGSNGSSGDGGQAVQASLTEPGPIAADASGNVFFADGPRVRRVSSGGIISTVATPAVTPGCLSINPAGELVMCNGSLIQRQLADGRLLTIAGGGAGGDGGQGTAASLNAPRSVVYDRAGNLYFADSGNMRVRRVAPDGVITTVAGTGRRGSSPDGTLAREADLNAPSAVAIDSDGNLYIAEQNRIRKVSPTGLMVTISGDGSFGFDGEGGLAIEAQFDGIQSMVIDPSGNLYIADGLNNRVRRLVALD